jgi:hypothetical protein
MTNFWQTFEGIVPEISDDRTAWTAAYNEVRQFNRRAGASVDVREYGRCAWMQLTDVQRAWALDSLFSAYFRVIHDEEQSLLLAGKAATDGSYLQPGDVDDLTEALLHQEGDGDQAVVVVLASSVANVLQELELLRHRLSMACPDGAE